MAILEEVEVLEHNIFIQRDARDPLGIWTCRVLVIGDASGAPITMRFLAPQTNRIYVCHAVTLSSTGSLATYTARLRLLTNFPPATPAGTTAGFSYNRVFSVVEELSFTSPLESINAASAVLMNGTDKLLLFGPIPADPGPVAIVELESSVNVLAATFFFEAWGYYWDKVGLLNTAGGPRFPGSD